MNSSNIVQNHEDEENKYDLNDFHPNMFRFLCEEHSQRSVENFDTEDIQEYNFYTMKNGLPIIIDEKNAIDLKFYMFFNRVITINSTFSENSIRLIRDANSAIEGLNHQLLSNQGSHSNYSEVSIIISSEGVWEAKYRFIKWQFQETQQKLEEEKKNTQNLLKIDKRRKKVCK